MYHLGHDFGEAVPGENLDPCQPVVGEDSPVAEDVSVPPDFSDDSSSSSDGESEPAFTADEVGA